MMGDLHGCRWARDRVALVMLDAPPLFHSHMVTLDPEAVSAQMALVEAQAGRAGFGIKDGFSRLDLSSHGLRIGFEAEWIWAEGAGAADVTGWERVDTPARLATFNAAWAAADEVTVEQFPEPVLARGDVALWGRRAGMGYDAGGIANLSDECVGLSNIFGDGAFAPVAALAGGFSPGLPLTGYERGDDLAAAKGAGFETVGRLRVWFPGG